MASKKFLNSLLSANRLAKHIGYRNFLQSFNKGLEMRITEKVPQGRVLVLSPHPDDDAFGCGGSLYKHALNGSEIRVVYFTGGNLKDPSSSEKTRGLEAKKALEVLGINDFVFGELEDGDILAKTAQALIKKEILDFKPDIIYLPTEIDDHADHREVTKGAKGALKEIEKGLGELDLYFYEIWAPLYPNRIVTIDSGVKLKAIRCHESQLKDRAYDKAILGLNTYRGEIFGAGAPAEAFWVIKGDLWMKLP